MSDHGIGWMSGVLGEDYAVTFVRGVTHQELAWMIGGDPDTVMDADTFGRLDAAAPFGTLPASAMLGETGTGWAFAIEPPGAAHEWYRHAALRRMWSSCTAVSIEDTMMGPGIIGLTVDGEHDWSYHGGEVGEGQENHPLTRRPADEVGLGRVVASENEDDPGDPDDGELFIPDDADIHRVLGEHYGLSLPRQAVESRSLQVVFFEPRTFLHPVRKVPDGPYDPCPVCGPEMAKWNGDGVWGPQYRLACGRTESDGCSGQRIGPLVQTGVRPERNTKWDNVCLPG
ncbi:hypothetical protein OG524_16475 [Streptomyces sp. NBC_01520]|uniref:hypothetical protein n=1 Tax=Streptomyces sp. NBC_01520 TaxID=2903892 RepID=UPI0038632260